MNDFKKSIIKETSVGLPNGGDTHFHLWEDQSGFTVTTRVPGGLDFHQDFSTFGNPMPGQSGW